jgi:hypothetical protein
MHSHHGAALFRNPWIDYLEDFVARLPHDIRFQSIYRGRARGIRGRGILYSSRMASFRIRSNRELCLSCWRSERWPAHCNRRFLSLPNRQRSAMHCRYRTTCCGRILRRKKQVASARQEANQIAYRYSDRKTASSQQGNWALICCRRRFSQTRGPWIHDSQTLSSIERRTIAIQTGRIFAVL